MDFYSLWTVSYTHLDVYKRQEYHILVENETDWSVEKEEVEETFRAVTGQTTISVNGKEVPYNQYLVSMGAAVDVEAEQEETDPGSFVKYVHLAYPCLLYTSGSVLRLDLKEPLLLHTVHKQAHKLI